MTHPAENENPHFSKLSTIKKQFFKKKYLLVLGILGFLVFMYFFILKDIPSTAGIGRNNYPQSTKIYDRNDDLLYTIYAAKNQSYVPLDKIPQDVKEAAISVEDKDFYKHGPIDLRGIARAVYSTVVKKEVQGGSTITQQLVKNSLLTPERTITRKVKEIILSFIVESVYSKDKIMEMYLNQVGYGGTAWGVQAASYVYFDKPVWKLDLAESAFLSALPEAPSIYSPFGAHPELWKVRQTEVLRKMREQGYVTPEEEKKALAKELVFSKIADKIEAPHFVFYVKDLLVQKYGQRRVEQGGLSVKTSLDLSLQNFAQQTVASEVAKLDSSNVSNGAALITNPATGEVLAMVGSRNFFDEEYDGNVNVTIAKRQPGSSIKPINYAAGLIKGYTAATPFVDNSKCFPNPGQAPYCPKNYDGKFHGAPQMRFALANSYNIPAVKMLKLNGVEAMIATASAMGIDTFKEPDRYGLSLTLGGGEVTMTDMAEAFGVFANMGYRVDLHPILKVTDSRGKVIEEYKPPKSPLFGEKVIPDGVAFIISHILQDNGARAQAFGANSVLRIKSHQISVKTGTTNDYRDNWTIGYTPLYVVAVWVGNNDNTPMKGIVSGVTGAAPIWNKLMTHMVDLQAPPALTKPDSVVGMHVCATTGLLPGADGSPNRCPTRFEYFLRGTQPKKGDNSAQKALINKSTNKLAKEGDADVEERDSIIVTDPLGDKWCATCAPEDNDAQLSPTPTP